MYPSNGMIDSSLQGVATIIGDQGFYRRKLSEDLDGGGAVVCIAIIDIDIISIISYAIQH